MSAVESLTKDQIRAEIAAAVAAVDGGGGGATFSSREFRFATTTRTDGSWTIIDLEDPTADGDPNDGMDGYTSPPAFHTIDGTGKILLEAGWYSLSLSINAVFDAEPTMVDVEWLDAGWSVDSFGHWEEHLPGTTLRKMYVTHPFAMDGASSLRGVFKWTDAVAMTSGNVYLGIVQHKSGL